MSLCGHALHMISSVCPFLSLNSISKSFLGERSAYVYISCVYLSAYMPAGNVCPASLLPGAGTSSQWGYQICPPPSKWNSLFSGVWNMVSIEQNSINYKKYASLYHRQQKNIHSTSSPTRPLSLGTDKCNVPFLELGWLRQKMNMFMLLSSYEKFSIQKLT